MVSIKKLIFLLFIAGLLSNCIGLKKEKTNLATQLDSIMTSIYRPDEPGASVLVYKKGEVLLQKGYGLANYETKEAITPDHVFNIGSITKQFTAQAILLLEEQGKLFISDPIHKYLPDYPHPEKKITIENMLTHTSGLVDIFEVSEWDTLWEKELTPQQFVDVFKDKPLLFEPGSQYHYSNLNYGVLGLIIEKISGKSYKDFITDNFFKPIGMNNTYILKNEDKIENLTDGYFKTNDGIEKTGKINYSHLYAAGSIWSCTEDMTKWYVWLSENNKNQDHKVKTALTPFILSDGSETNNGYGMMLYKVHDYPAAGNNGGGLGYTNYTLWLFEDDIIVVLLSNIIYEDSDPDLKVAYNVTSTAKKLAEVVMGVNSFTPKFITIPEKELDKYTGVYKIEENVFRIITRRGNQLFTRRTGNEKIQINPLSETQFFGIDKTRIEFVFDENGKVVEANWRKPDGALSVAKLTDLPLPEDKKPVSISENDFNAVCGLYKMFVVFNVKVYRNDSISIMIESKQRGKTIFYPESPTKFFYKEDDNLVIDFVKNKKGIIDEMRMTMNGRTFSAKRNN